jgi:hypothetical protein
MDHLGLAWLHTPPLMGSYWLDPHKCTSFVGDYLVDIPDFTMVDNPHFAMVKVPYFDMVDNPSLRHG